MTAVRVTSAVAVLDALASGERTIKGVANRARMTESAVQQAFARQSKKGHAERTNKKGVGVVATFRITPAGRKWLRAEKKHKEN